MIVFVDVVAAVSFAKNAAGWGEEDNNIVFFVQSTMRLSLVAENPRKRAAGTGMTIQFVGWGRCNVLSAG